MKVFGIGMSRTGTSSLAAALRILGYKTVHFPRSLEELSRHDAATDATVACRYRDLDEWYPESKFILTVRDMESWLKSMTLLFGGKNVAPEPWASFERIYFYGKRILGPKDRYLLQDAYEKHIREVTAYFQSKLSRLLVLDICGGEGWSRLCPFLKKPIPPHPFPHLNQGCTNHYKNQS